ncbi:MAG TPA: TIGR03118 family protein [Bryobacteraceae bacterium]|nr:TIGR03118 family protein [Bryobacteraceae bacterium]
MTATVIVASAQTGSNLYLTTNLVSNIKGLAPIVDPNLADPWGISFSSSSPFWVSNHLSGTSTLYNGSGAITPLVVTVPKGSASASGSPGRPTGQVWNGTATAFLLPAPGNGRAASFIFATEDGTISGWNGGTTALVEVDNSANQAAYKGLAIGTSAGGPTLYAANFRSGKIDVFNSSWAPAALTGNFSDPGVPSGFAPFNIWNLNGSLYVTYARQDPNKFLDVGGAGNGYVSVFDLNGNLLNHLISSGALNSPWGVAIAPAGWGAFGGALLVGNFGDGRINAFDVKTGNLLGTLQDKTGNPITLAGLWAIVFGNGGRGGDQNTLYFAAGTPNGSTTPRGVLGSIAPPAAITSIINAASAVSGAVAPGEIVVIHGQTVGPSPAVTATIPPTSGPLATTLGNTTVTFNGTKAPIIYANAGGTSVQVPYGVSGSTAANVVVTVGNQVTSTFMVQVAPTAPGLFTIDFSGKGQTVALNADGSVNSSKNPAARGSMIWLFATGAGITQPPDMDGIAETDMTRVPVAPLAVTVNGVSATLGPYGSTAMDVAGVLEMQVTVPNAITTGVSDVRLTAGGVTTTQPTVVYVK